MRLETFFENYTGNLKDFLDKTCELLNTQWKTDNVNILAQGEELNEAIITTFEIFSENAFNKFSKSGYTGIFNRPVYDIMTYYFSFPQIKEAALNNKNGVVEIFEQLCTNDGDFLKSLETSTKNIEPTIKRFSTWGLALKNLFNIDIKVPFKTNEGIKFQ